MDVDHFKPGNENTFPDECELMVMWEKEHQTPVKLIHQVKLIGARAPHNFFNLYLDPDWEGIVHLAEQMRRGYGHAQLS